MSRRILLICAIVALTACGGTVTVQGPVTTRPPASTTTADPAQGGGETSMPPAPTTTLPLSTTTLPDSTNTARDDAGLVIYLLTEGADTANRRGPFLVPVHRRIPSTPTVARAAIEELLKGPEPDETAAGITSAVPEGVVLLDVIVDEGTAIVDLSGEFQAGGGSFSMFARLAQLVYTLTRFPTVERVELHLDGEPIDVFSSEGLLIDGPLTREDYLELVPAILVEDPAHGASVDTPLRVRGTAAVFEATFQMEVLDADGGVLARPDFVMTDEGQGWGAFDISLDIEVIEPTPAVLRVWSHSAADGSVEALREHRITLTP